MVPLRIQIVFLLPRENINISTPYYATDERRCHPTFKYIPNIGYDVTKAELHNVTLSVQLANTQPQMVWCKPGWVKNYLNVTF